MVEEEKKAARQTGGREGQMNERSVKKKGGMGEWGRIVREICPHFPMTGFTS